MSQALADHETMSFDDFEEALADKPRNEKWELIGGRVVRLMVGARWEHAAIVTNFGREIGNRLDAAGRDCFVFSESFYLKEKLLDAAMLPDIMVVCGDLEPGATSTNQPVVLVEVMSAGSEVRDRLEKWLVYQQLPSLRHYVLVARDRVHAEVYDRPGAEWSGFRTFDGLDATLSLPAIDVAVPLAAVYRRVFA